MSNCFTNEVPRPKPLPSVSGSNERRRQASRCLYHRGRMGRKARRRAEEKAAAHHPGNPGEPHNEADRLERCPRCGSTNLAEGLQGTWPGAGLTVVCGNCGWQGVYRPGMWG